ncbi:MAG: hypothetical protein AAGK00_13255 [Pseudomonadota bacterium]
MKQGNRKALKFSGLGLARIFSALMVLALLGGCQSDQQVGTTGRAEVTWNGPVTAPPTDPDMVLAPEVFSVSGTAIWNGQRSVGGFWLAHPLADKSRKVRVVRPETDVAVDAMLYGTDQSSQPTRITVSHQTARALGLAPNIGTRLDIFALRSAGSTPPVDPSDELLVAERELAARISKFSNSELLLLAAAVLRGMGYETSLEPGPIGWDIASIRAFTPLDADYDLPSVRLLTRARGSGAVDKAEMTALMDWLNDTGDIGVLVSLPGISPDALRVAGDIPAFNLVDLTGLLHLWQVRYTALGTRDQALLPLEPVYFLAGS